MERKKYTIEDLSKIPQIYLPTVSHSKDSVAFYWDKTGILELYTLNVRTKEVKQVSHGECPRAIRAGFVWLRNDENLVFAKDLAGDENHNLIRININSGEVVQLTDTPKHQDYPGDTSPDGRYLLMPSTRKGQLNLFRLDLDKKRVIQLTGHKNPTFGEVAWNPKIDWIAYSVNETGNLQNLDVWLVRADGNERRRIICMKVGSMDYVAEWSRDGKMLAFTTNANGVNQAGVYDAMTEEVRLLGEAKHEETAAAFTEDGKKLVCLRNREATVTPVVYHLETGGCDVPGFPTGVVAGAKLAFNDRYLVAMLSTPTIPSSLVAYDFERNEVQTLIEPQYGNVDPDFFVVPQYVKYKSHDGLEIAAVLYKPKHVPIGERLPALVMVHGGPSGQYFLNFNMFGQVLANEGYLVLQPNVRGSTGYGKAFEDMNLMDWGGGDLEDAAAGAEYLVALPYVDGKEIGVFGGSYGGYMTFMAVTKKPTLWSAACAWIGISRLKTLYERSTALFKYYLRMNMGNPEENSALWEERSALNFAGNLRCPLLMVHGVHDPRCPVEESRQFRDKLIELGREEGKDFEYVEFGEEGHGAYTDMSMRTRTFKLLLDFFNRKLKRKEAF